MWTCGVYVLFMIVAGFARVRGECTSIPAVDNSFNNATGTGTYPTGAVVQFSCYRGYTAYGSLQFVCRDGGFSGDLKCVPIYCPQTDIDNGHVSNEPSYEAGTIVTYECDKGYKMEGNATMLCKENGQWSPVQPPRCTPKSCGEFGVIANGSVVQEHKNGQINSFGSTVKVTCNAGYILQGNKYVTCDSNSQWTTRPRCEKSRCPRHPALGTNCLSKSVFSKDSLYLKCKEDTSHTARGALTAQCTEENRWTDLDTGCFCNCRLNGTAFSSLVDPNSIHKNKNYLPHDERISWECPFCRVKSSEGDIVCYDGAFSVSNPYCKADPVCIVLFLIAAFIILIASVTVLCFCWRKKKCCFEYDDDDSDMDGEEMKNMMSNSNGQSKKPV